MIGLARGLGRLVLSASALVVCAAAAAAQTAPDQPPSNSVCGRLEAQLASVDRGTADPGRSDLISHAEEAVAKQQADLDRLTAQSHRVGCEGIAGFFSLFTGQSQQCQPLNAQIQQIRGNLDRMMSDLERLKSGGSDREGQRRGVIAQLAQNNCGAQYTRAAAQTGPSNFLETILGGIINPGGDGGPAGTYRTVCVRTCDGYFFPVSYSTVPDHFADDQRSCQRMCPASEAVLYSYRNPGEDITQAVSVSGRTYTELPNAFRYRREFTPGCSCRRPGQSWADALKNSDDSSTLGQGDIVVTEQNSKALSQAPQKGAGGKSQVKGAAPQPSPETTATTPGTDMPTPDQHKGPVRTVGPPFVAAH